MTDLPFDGFGVDRRTFLQLSAIVGFAELPSIWSHLISREAPPALGLYLSPSSSARLNTDKVNVAKRLGCFDFVTTDLYGPAKWRGKRDVFFSLGDADDIVASSPVPLPEHRDFLAGLKDSAIHAPLLLTSTRAPDAAASLFTWLRSALPPGNIVTVDIWVPG